MSAQKLESQHTGALERSQIIKDELILERQNNEELKYQLEEFEELLGRDERNQEDLESLQLHIQEQEGVIRWSSLYLYLYLSVQTRHRILNGSTNQGVGRARNVLQRTAPLAGDGSPYIRLVIVGNIR